MGEFELSETAQHWFNVTLIWVGFGTLAGLLGRSLMPAREPSGAVVIVMLGIVGSVIGPLALTFFLGHRLVNPLGPLGLLAATAGALLLLIVYRLLLRAPKREDDDAAKSE